MAYLPQEDKNKKLGLDGEGGSAVVQGQPGGAQSPVNPGGQFAGQSGGQTPQGTGGTLGWTNIQDYVSANQGSQGSSNLLKDKIGNQFEQSKQDLESKANEVRSKAEEASKKVVFNQDQASQAVKEAAKLYQYPTQPAAPNPTGTVKKPADPSPLITYDIPYEDTINQEPESETNQPTQSYDDIVNQFKSQLNAQYEGPSQFTYGFDAPTQEYGTNLGSQQGFQAILNSLYDDSTGKSGAMGTGSKALQYQLDQDNPYVNNARQELSNQYQGLEDFRNQAIGEQDYYNEMQDNFRTSQDQLKTFLNTQQGDAKTALEQAVSDWNSTNESSKSQYIQELTNLVQKARDTGVYDLWDSDPGYWSAQQVNPIRDREGNYVQQHRPELDLNSYLLNGAGADLTNVPIEDDSRSLYNTISQILGSGDLIGKSSEGPSGYSADIQRLREEILGGARRTIDELYASGYENLAKKQEQKLSGF